MKHRIALMGLVILLTSTVGWTLARAQDEDDDGSACRAACAEQEQTCLTTCNENDDPIECESNCRNTAWACQDECQ